MIKQKVKEITYSGSQCQVPGLEPRPLFSNSPCIIVDDVNFHKNIALSYSHAIQHWHFWKTVDEGKLRDLGRK